MAEDNFTVTTFYSSWKAYQEHISRALTPLTNEQLTLRPAPHLRSIGEIIFHIVACRAYWFTQFLGEAGDEQMQVYTNWNEAALTIGASVPPSSELGQALDHTWQFMANCLNRWNSTDMQQTFPDEWEGQSVQLSRAWVVWHVLEHDLHHGGELSLTLGIYQLESNFPG
jgi:uncharacterized damage-inducible protein DinB